LLKNTWTKGVSWELAMEGPLNNYNYEWEVINSTKHMTSPTSTLYVRIYSDFQLFDFDLEKITLSFNDSTQLVDSTNGFDMVDTGIEFYLKGRETYTFEGYWIGLYLFVIGYGLIIVFAFATTFLGFSGWIAIDVICSLQMLHLIPVCRIYLPTVLLRFFRMFRFLNFEGLSFGQWQFTRTIDDMGFTKNGVPVNYNFEKMGYDTKAFFNLTSEIWLFMTYACFAPALLALLSTFLHKSSIAKNLERNLLSTFFTGIIAITMTKL
jgi:hypothetical protein